MSLIDKNVTLSEIFHFNYRLHYFLRLLVLDWLLYLYQIFMSSIIWTKVKSLSI